MFSIRNSNEQLIEARLQNEKLQADLIKATADMAYIAMMTDVELDEEDETDGDEQV